MVSEPVQWLFDLQRIGVKLGLDNIRALLSGLDHPESTYRSVLVGGTNGKGSVAAMLESVFHEAGLRTGLFTSPHLVRPEERIRLSTRDIATPDFLSRLAAVRETCRRLVETASVAAHPSFFEVVTGTALAAFREASVEVAVLEVGLGGRLDATNAVPASMSVIVSIELDHAKTLGPTRAHIAGEKAGIVKDRRPLVTGAVGEDAAAVLRARCRECRARWIDAARAATITPAGDGSFRIDTASAAYRDLRVPLAGRHQMENARVAVVAYETWVEEGGIPLETDAVRRGLAAVRWPGRLQWIEGDPPLLLDGAHNPAGAAALADYLRERGGPRPVLVLSTMRDKDIEGILRPLASEIDSAVVTRPPFERAADPTELAERASRFLRRVEIEPDPASALERARDLARPGGFVLVAGSLYLVGTILGLVSGTPSPGPVPL